jgi:hypothetical protein
MAAGLALAFGLRAIHDSIFAYGGLGFVAVTLAAIGVITVSALRRSSPPTPRAAGIREATRG